MNNRVHLLAVVVFATVSVGTGFVQSQVQPSGADSAPAMVYIVTGVKATGLYHRKDCPWLRDASMQIFMLREAKDRYFQPHCLCIVGTEGAPPCDPAAALAATTTAPATTTSTTPPIATAVREKPAAAPKAPAAARTQCAATTKKGARCSRMADVGSAYCWQHK